jgi:hypothetical protein
MKNYRFILLLLLSGVTIRGLYGQVGAYRLTNVPSKTTSRMPIASGPTVLGVFDGRFPCAEIYRDWKLPARPDCQKLKWSLVLFYNPENQQPTTYSLNRGAREGKWAIVRGTPTDPEAIVYQLDSDKPEVSIYLLKGDDNVLFVLDQQRNFRVGDSYLSYNLNRVVN